MPVPLLAVLGTFLGGIRAITARRVGGNPAERTYTDPLGNKFTFDKYGNVVPVWPEGTKLGDVLAYSREIERAGGLDRTTRQYNRLIGAYQTLQGQKEYAAALRQGAVDIGQAQKIDKLSAALEDREMALPLFILAGLVGAYFVLR